MSPKVLLAVALSALLAPAGAVAYTTQGSGSRDGRMIPYYNAVPEHDWAVRVAVRAWNDSGAQVEFVPASHGEAEVVIRGDLPGLDGRTETVTRGSDPQPGDAQVDLPSPSVAKGDGRFRVALIAAHELGHVVKLGHEDSRCSLMNSTIVNGAPARCRQPPAGKWDCGLLEEDDIRGAVALYGGHPRLPRHEFCPKVPPKPKPPPPLPPEDLSSAGGVEVTSAPARSDRVLVRWLNGDSSKLRAAVVTRAAGRCPDKPSEGDTETVRASPGTQGSASFGLELKRSCYAVWSRDQSGALSRRPATAWLEPPPPPGPPRNFVAEPAFSGPFGDTAVSLQWRNTDEGTLASVVTARAKGRCPARPPSVARPWESSSARAGSFQQYLDLGFYPSSDMQRYCYAAWSRDRFGRLSRPVTAWPKRSSAEDEVIILARARLPRGLA